MGRSLRLLLWPPLALGRGLRALLGPLAHELWIYVAFPSVAFLAEFLAKPGQSLYDYAAEFGHIFTLVTCLGLPAHLVYAHFGDRFLTPRFQWREIPIHALIIGSAVLVGTELAIRLIIFFARPGIVIDPEHVWHFRQAVWFGMPIAIGLVTAIFVSRWRYQLRIAEFERREQEAQRAALRAQVEALQARIQPHFLFNCLNTVAGLIEEDPRKAEAAVERVSDLFRYTLDASKGTIVPLESELVVVNDYLELERLRYGSRLDATVRVDPAAREVAVPPLTLQPIVENAVLHGIATRREGGRLEVEARVENGSLELCVEDDGPGLGGSRHTGSGTALADLRKRLDFVYAGAACVCEDTGPLGGFRVRIRLPLQAGVEA